MSRRGRYEFPNEIKETARKAARYQCTRCGRKGHTEAHHRVPIYIAEKLREKEPELFSYALITSLANCEILCPNCHEEADRETHDWVPFAQGLFGAIQMKLL